MTVTEILARLDGAGIQIRADGGRLIAAPKERITDELRTEIRDNKADLLRELAHADGPAPSPIPAPDHGAECMRCAHLTMRVEAHQNTRRIFWWRCARGHELMEGRNYGERVLIAPPECDSAGDFEQWREGAR